MLGDGPTAQLSFLYKVSNVKRCLYVASPSYGVTPNLKVIPNLQVFPGNNPDILEQRQATPLFLVQVFDCEHNKIVLLCH